jgi:hypothetical protein
MHVRSWHGLQMALEIWRPKTNLGVHGATTDGKSMRTTHEPGSEVVAVNRTCANVIHGPNARHKAVAAAHEQ